MPLVQMIASASSVELLPAPIEPSWIRKGEPRARCATLSRSADRLASTMVWDCTAGEFAWHYDVDETILILEGSATISDGHGPAKTFAVGDVLYMPRGAVCHWRVDDYVRKVAFCRRAQPMLISIAIRAVGQLRRMVKRVRTAPIGSGSLEVA